MSVDTLLHVENVSRTFGGVTALDDVSLTIDRGELVGLIGPNGAGKTTLINVVSGAEKPSSGQVHFDGRSAAGSLERSVDRGIVRTFQTPRAFSGLTVRENLRIARSSPSARSSTPTIPADVLHTIQGGLEPWMGSVVADLPFGVLRRLSIVLALSTNPTLLLMDEPCVGLTMHEVEELAAVIRTLHGHGLTILLVEHNVAFVMQLAVRVAVLHKGALLFTGTPEECRANSDVQDVYLGRTA
ncbi:MAG: transporter related [Blastococcus sp.]|jgi:branched-chain amino acid transport system ATP-binding protein|nr:transporter related [Blastococcus sp.]